MVRAASFVRRGQVMPAVAAALVAAAVGAAALARTRSYDYVVHAQVAQAFAQGRQPPLPQFLLEVLALVLHAAVGGTFLGALKLLAVAFYALLGVATWLYWRARTGAPHARGSIALAAGVCACVVLQAPVFLPTAVQHNLYLGYATANVYHNPTVVLLKPLAVLLFLFAARALEGGPATRRSLAAAAALSLLSTAAKPSLAIVLLPALVLLAVTRQLRGRAVHWPLLAAVATPAVLLLLAQLVLYRNLGRGMVFHPMYAIDSLAAAYHRAALMTPPWLVAKLLLSLPLPLVVTAGWFAEVRRDPPMLLAWSTLGFAVLAVVLVTEAVEPFAANLAWSLQVSAFLLFLASLATAWRVRGPRFGRLEVLVSATVVLQVGCGLAWLATQSGPAATSWW